MEIAEGTVDVDGQSTAYTNSKSDVSTQPPSTSTHADVTETSPVAQAVRGESEPSNVTYIVLKPSKETTVDAITTTTKAISPSTASQSFRSSSPSQVAQASQAHNASEMAAPSPYGTRSRNRTGTTRPNYAEDRELEMDYEWSSKKALGNSATSNPPQAAEADKASSSGSRRSTTTTNGSGTAKAGAAGVTTSKDYIPGMSTFLVNSDPITNVPPPSKKRKAPGSVANTVTPSGNGSPHAQTRKASHAAPSSGANRREANMFSFENSQGYLKNNKLKADDGTLFAVNDHVYLVCEPPGEPYYLARIMEFLHTDNDRSLPIEFLRINWVYRPRDIGRKVNDTRLVFVSMHSDTCPLTSLRGKARVLHRNDIGDLDEYRKVKDNFWFSQMFDRYMRRFYDVIPTNQVINVPERVKKVLDERWKFLIVEIGRGKELTSAIKTCRRCVGYCASNDSVDCAMCKNTYHMNCVRPPLLKKPARGFAWSCGPCSRKQEKKLEARNTPIVGQRSTEGEEEEYADEEEDEHGLNSNPTNGSSPGDLELESGPRPATAEQIAQAKLWPYRYLGAHCRVEDALDYDDRIYPRASSRLGPRHQANVIVWHGRPLELVKPAEIKRKYVKGGGNKKDAKSFKESIAAIEADKLEKEKRPKWVIDEPSGYVRRGDDHPKNDPANTAKLRFRLPQLGEKSSRGEDSLIPTSSDGMTDSYEHIVEDYMTRAKGFANKLGVKEYSTNFLDKALELLYENKFVAATALQQLQHLNRRKDLKEPELNKEELKRFEEGVSKYGTNLHEVSRHVGKSQKHADIVRYYYMWKKTDRGKQIWGNFEGRKSKKQAKNLNLDSTLVDDVADDQDDSAFDNDKAVMRKREFECKFCFTRKSPQWRRAPGTAPGTTVPAETSSKSGRDKATHLMVALCQRCAGLWRKYAIQWENIDEVAKKVAQSGGRAWKRKMDEELLIELVNANEASSVGMSSTAVAAAASVGIDVPQSLTIHPEQEAARKKQKTSETSQRVVSPTPPEPPKKKVVEKPPEPPLIPEPPKIKALPCAVCNEMEPTGEQHFCCRHCRLTVHRNCYGIAEGRSASKWICDMCSNDATGQLSTSYECALCPIRFNEFELMEPPKTSHKKKSEREREKERLEKELVVEATEQYRRKQDEMGRPMDPREPLKKTSGNNWVHVVCAVWTPWIKFGNAKALEPSEGLGSVPIPKQQEACKLCKSTTGVCVTCHRCPSTFHVTCAQRHGFLLGFDVTPVKGSRRDVINTVALGGEVGNVEAVIYCRDHSVKTILHPMNEPTDDPALNALQLFVRNFKQADLSLTGTVRKAAIINSSTKMPMQASQNSNGHRTSVSNGSIIGVPGSATVPTTRSSRVSPTALTVKSEEVDGDGDRVIHLIDEIEIEPISKECSLCGTRSSPKWHKSSKAYNSAAVELNTVDRKQIDQSCTPQTNGHICGDLNEGSEKPNTHAITYPKEEPNGLSERVRGNDAQKDSEVRVNRQEDAETPPLLTVDVERSVAPDSSIEYRCHSCYLKKLKEPSPPPVKLASGTDSLLAAQEVQTLETQVHSPNAWPAVAAVLPPRAVEGWPSQSVLQNSSPMRIPNGVSHSSPTQPAPHTLPHYPTIPPHYFPNGHEQRFGAGIPQQTNGAHSAQQTARPIPGHLEAAPLAPYTGPSPYHGSPQYRCPTSNGIRSPPVTYRATHPVLGPNRAAENPFVYVHHSSPRQHYLNGHNSPQHRVTEERPVTPTDTNGRNGSWTGADGQMTNGASASPSLRNLLH